MAEATIETKNQVTVEIKKPQQSTMCFIIATSRSINNPPLTEQK